MLEEHIFFSYPVIKQKRINSASTTVMITRAPWQAGVNKYYKIHKIVVSNFDGSPATLHLWDQDLSSTTPAGRGSASAALITVGVGAGGASGVACTTKTITEQELPKERFFAGISAQATSINVHVMIECRVI